MPGHRDPPPHMKQLTCEVRLGWRTSWAAGTAQRCCWPGGVCGARPQSWSACRSCSAEGRGRLPGSCSDAACCPSLSACPASPCCCCAAAWLHLPACPAGCQIAPLWYLESAQVVHVACVVSNAFCHSCRVLQRDGDPKAAVVLLRNPHCSVGTCSMASRATTQLLRGRKLGWLQEAR